MFDGGSCHGEIEVEYGKATMGAVNIDIKAIVQNNSHGCFGWA